MSGLQSPTARFSSAGAFWRMASKRSLSKDVTGVEELPGSQQVQL